MNKFELMPLEEKDVEEIVSAFKKIGWSKPRSIYETYLRDQSQNLRSIIVAKDHETFSGYVTIKWRSDYPPFTLHNIPEIADLNVLPHVQKKGLGKKLIQACENMATKRGFHEIGLGVGMTADYGSAQRLYVHLGYSPDGRGLHYKNKPLNHSEMVMVDDDLVLYFTKELVL